MVLTLQHDLLPLEVSTPSTMQPIYVKGALGWLHMPARPSGSFGVVLCPALGREARWSYRTLRVLADRLAASGFPTVRFDYPGLGDSIDLPDWEEPLAAWRDGVHAFCDWLRAHTGLQKVAIGGCRFGATLATEAAYARTDVVALALLGPVLSGRAYARELRLTLSTPDGKAATAIELEGMELTDATLKAIQQIDLTRADRSPARHILVLDPNDSAGPYVQHLATLGVAADRRNFPGYADMMRVATSSTVPELALNMIAEWFNTVHCGSDSRVPRDWTALDLPQAVVRHADYREQVLQFGAGKRLAGVLCRPVRSPHNDLAVLITNTGGDPRCGIARFGALLARRLASQGYASMRFDFGGLGDSRLDGDRHGHLFDEDRTEDIKAAIDLLEAKGYRRVAATGVCSGAYHAFRVALADSRISQLILINLVTFAWQPGMPVEQGQKVLGHPTARYRQLLFQPVTWMRLLRGQVDFRHVARTLAKRVLDRALRLGAAMLAPLGLKTRLDAPRRMMQSLLQNGTSVLALWGFDDPGVAALEAAFGHRGKHLAAMPGATVWLQREVDHTLSTLAMQEQIVGVLETYIGLADATHPERSQRGSPVKGSRSLALALCALLADLAVFATEVAL